MQITKSVSPGLIEVLGEGRKMLKQGSLSPRQSEVLGRIIACGTGRLGAHYYHCMDCGHQHMIAHSCRDRHCPRCQKHKSDQWLARQKSTLLPVPYFHVVFTLPHGLNPVIRQNKRACLNLLFKAASKTVLTFAKNNHQCRPGITAVLHTWGQTLCEHYHVHLIVTGGGLSLCDDQWIETENKGKWLYSTRALAKVYQAIYLNGLEKLHKKGQLNFFGGIEHWASDSTFKRQLRGFAKRKWNVYAKQPFGGPEQVLSYLSLYTHRVAISNNRIKSIDPDKNKVRFSYKNYRKDGRWETISLSCDEFTRRFCSHILPKRFCKIRHYGILANNQRKDCIALARAYLPELSPDESSHSPIPEPESIEQSADSDGNRSISKCAQCGSTRLRWTILMLSIGQSSKTEIGRPGQKHHHKPP